MVTVKVWANWISPAAYAPCSEAEKIKSINRKAKEALQTSNMIINYDCHNIPLIAWKWQRYFRQVLGEPSPRTSPRPPPPPPCHQFLDTTQQPFKSYKSSNCRSISLHCDYQVGPSFSHSLDRCDITTRPLFTNIFVKSPFLLYEYSPGTSCPPPPPPLP